MQDNEALASVAPKRGAWNKGKLIGAKPPPRPKHVWSIRTKLQVADRKRAMFNLAIDSKLRGCDVVALKVEDIAPHGYAVRSTCRRRPRGSAAGIDLTGPRSLTRRPSRGCRISWRRCRGLRPPYFGCNPGHW
jgi:hypothetical protein